MELKFKNTHIFFATESIWGNLDYKFKYLLNQIVTANQDDEFVQTIEVSEDILLQIFSSVTVQPEGVAAATNAEMLEALIPQIQAVSNSQDVINNGSEPNEGARILFAINEISFANKSVNAGKILKGKNQILS